MPCLLSASCELDGQPDPVEIAKEFLGRALPEDAESLINIPLPQPKPGRCCLQCQLLKELRVRLATTAETVQGSLHRDFLLLIGVNSKAEVGGL